MTLKIAEFEIIKGSFPGELRRVYALDYERLNKIACLPSPKMLGKGLCVPQTKLKS